MGRLARTTATVLPVSVCTRPRQTKFVVTSDATGSAQIAQAGTASKDDIDRQLAMSFTREI